MLQLFERGVNLFFSLFISLYLVRCLGPENYGIWAYAQSYVFLFSVLVTCGLQNIVIKMIVQNVFSKESILGSAFILMAVGAVVLIFVVVLIAYSMKMNLVIFKLIFLIALANMFMCYNVVAYFFQAILKTKYIAFALLVQDIVDAIGKLCFIILDLPLFYLGIIYFIEILAMLIMLYIFYIKVSKSYALGRWNIKKDVICKLIKESLPLFITGMFTPIYMRIDQIMIDHYCGIRMVGEYSAGVRLVEILYFFPTIIIGNLLSVFVRLNIKNKSKYFLRLSQTYGIALYICILTSIFYYFFSYQISSFLFGPSYKYTGLVMSVSIWGFVFTNFMLISNLYLIPHGLQLINAIRAAIGLVVNIILNALLIPLYGPIGASIASIGGLFALAIVSQILFKKTRANIFCMLYSPLLGLINPMGFIKLCRSLSVTRIKSRDKNKLN